MMSLLIMAKNALISSSSLFEGECDAREGDECLDAVPDVG